MAEEKQETTPETSEEKEQAQPPRTSKNTVTIEDAGPCKKKVVVEVVNEEELRELQEQATGLGIPNELIQDAGLTELPPGTTTVLALGPAPNDVIDKVTRGLPLL
jgi:peptidyl-tRNA hydrolase